MAMPRFKLRAWTGPTCVREIAQALGTVDEIASVSAGTEHVYFECEGTTDETAAWNARAAIFGKLGRDFGLKIVAC